MKDNFWVFRKRSDTPFFPAIWYSIPHIQKEKQIISYPTHSRQLVLMYNKKTYWIIETKEDVNKCVRYLLNQLKTKKDYMLKISHSFIIDSLLYFKTQKHTSIIGSADFAKFVGGQMCYKGEWYNF